MTAFSVIQSGFGFVGGPELVYEFGTTALWIFFTAPLGFLLTWVVLAKRLRLLADIRNVLTLADGMYVRYERLGARTHRAGRRRRRDRLPRDESRGPAVRDARDFRGSGHLGPARRRAHPVALQHAWRNDRRVWTDFLQALTMITGAVFVFAYAMSFGGGMGTISRNLATADPAPHLTLRRAGRDDDGDPRRHRLVDPLLGRRSGPATPHHEVLHEPQPRDPEVGRTHRPPPTPSRA